MMTLSLEDTGADAGAGGLIGAATGALFWAGGTFLVSPLVLYLLPTLQSEASEEIWLSGLKEKKQSMIRSTSVNQKGS